MQDIFIVGCGYVGQRLAQHVFAQDDEVEVMALARSAQSHEQIQQMGIISVPGDLDNRHWLSELPTDQTIVYYFAPPPSTGIEDARLGHFLEALKTKQYPDKIVLISTTSVYGDCAGAWITEQHPLNPQTDRARRRINAETRLLAWHEKTHIPISIIRVPGIYGPGRLPVARLEQGLPVLLEAESPYSNRIHVDDLVMACLLAGNSPDSGLFHVSDGHPTTMTDYFYQVADVFGYPRPPAISRAEAQQQLSAEMLSYLAESKRLNIQLISETLGYSPYYPHLADGLAQCREESEEENE
ncbi:SDR family oxidoreductase [Thioflexithrix psekupsensis]|uniref:NAD-dependent epimerase/dehydratase domain-containing protein n=1 Tax=Thioflexithrix psekupsensis TaxID=1570016 RepID=A0A251X5V3_9GAMM|nr:SDR family oxidoreductase [Thioflexithrix psekupsensis]OUD12579.1 hypothetical protein TPSD3_15970 [Thioflexithrix psekupsensis]